MTRRLSAEENALWDRLRSTVKPLRRAALTKPAKAGIAATFPSAKKPKPVAHAPTAIAAKPKPASPPSLAPLEARTLRRLGRGLLAVDDRIDLHGMRQERAYHALAGFLRHAQARGHRMVVVVTGKGKASENAPPGAEVRGILRHVVPAWLARDDFREFVVGFDEAARRHGGSGALYVRIRRRRAFHPP